MIVMILYYFFFIFSTIECIYLLFTLLIYILYIGECICAPFVTGTEEAPCSECEENTFGYDPITGCQECKCMVEGTVAGQFSSKFFIFLSVIVYFKISLNLCWKHFFLWSNASSAFLQYICMYKGTVVG